MNQARKKAKQLAVIGWREMLMLPELNIARIKAKIDTGARTSSLHAFDCQEFEWRGTRMIHFKTHPIQKDKNKITVVAAKLLEYRQVTNSGGQAQVRPVILTTIELGVYKWQSEITLSNREGMGFRMLLGRQTVRDLFLVDPRQSFLQSTCRH